MPDCGSEHGGDSYLLFQSRYKAPTEICLTENVVVPARTELVLEGKLVKTTSADVGMITANRARAYEPGIHISHIVAHPCGKIVPVRVLNSSHEPVELTAGRKIAEFHQLVKSKPQSEQYTKTTNATCAATCSETADFQSQVHEAISPHLNEKDRIKLAQLLSEFSDVFDDKLDTCNVTSHKINTGRSTPIKQRPRRLPYAYRDEADQQIQEMLRHYDKLFIRDGILVRAIGQRKSYPNYVIVLAQSLITTCVKAMHDSPFAGHMGVARTEERIRQRFYWPGIHNSVQTFIHNCHACAQRKIATHNNKAPTQHIEVGEPFTFWAIDYMGPLPETARGNRHILVMMDHFSKWCEAFPTKDQKASTVANILLHKVFSRFGPPTVLHSDQGANFESNLMHELCDLMGIAKTRTSAYHPQCDGQVERQNRTLQDMLSKFVSNHADDWDQWLDPVVFAYNTSRHDSTGYSPYEMIFGRTPRMPFELEIGMPLSNPAQNTEYIHSTRRTLQDIHNIARSNLADNRARQDKRNAKSTSWKPYLAGQAVWLKRPKQWKFGPTWVGPYQVLERLGVNYRIKRQDGKVSIVHHDNLKLSRIPSGNGQIVPPTPESGDLEVVEPLFEAQNVGCEGTRGTNSVPRVRLARLRQNVQPPKRYGVD